MASRLSRAWLTRTAVAVAVSAVPLFAAGAAQASIAGGNPATASNYPVPRGATILDATDVQVCFDKALSQSSDVFSNPAHMYLAGYNAGPNDGDSPGNQLFPLGATLDQHNNQCVDLAFNSHNGQLDLNQYTVVSWLVGAVQAAGNGGGTSNADSVTLSTGTAGTHNGTAGLSSGPDLVGPAPVPTATVPNAIAFVFDQNVDPTNVGAASNFWYENAQGGVCYGASVVDITGSVVTVVFPTSNSSGVCNDTVTTNPTVANARRAGVNEHTVFSVADQGEVGNAAQGTNMPNAANGGATSIASLDTAALGPESNQVTYTFDHPLDGAMNNANDFFVLLSDGSIITGDTVTGGSGANQVVVTYTGFQNVNEYGVQAGVFNDAAEATSHATGSDGSTTYTNTPGAAAIGGNAGAFARGFTTGPDAYAVSFDNTNHVATIAFDQRVSGTYWDGPSDTTHIEFLNSNGDIVGSPTSVNIPSFPNAGPVAITMDYSNAVGALKPTQIALDAGRSGSDYGGDGNYCAFYTDLGPFINNDDGNACSVQQTVKQVGVAAHVRAIKVAKKSHKARRAHKAHRAHKSHKRA